MKQAIPILTLPVLATGAIAAGRCVTPLGAQAGAGVNTLGVAISAAGSGDTIPVAVLGTAVATCGAAVTKGDTLKADTNGKLITWATSGAKVAIALETTGAADVDFEVLLIPNAA